jgi:hypothetical protein
MCYSCFLRAPSLDVVGPLVTAQIVLGLCGGILATHLFGVWAFGVLPLLFSVVPMMASRNT